MEFVELIEAEYAQYFSNHPKANFWQSIEMANMRKQNNWQVAYVGVKQNQSLVAAAPLYSQAVYRGYRVFMILRGFLMDYDDEDLLCFFLEHLKKYLYAHKCLFVRMDPYVEYQPHTPDGGVIEGAWKNDHLIEIFQRYGFEHQGFRTKNDNNYEPRWMSVISLEGKDETAVLKQMHGQTRRNIKFVERNGIKTRELAYDEMDRLYTLVNMTGDRKHFENPTLAYYQSFYTAFKEHKIALYAYLDTQDFYDRNRNELINLQKKEEMLKQRIQDQPLTDKNKHKWETLQKEIQIAQTNVAQAQELIKEHGAEIPLAAGLFVSYPSEIIYLFGGSDDRYKHFRGGYAIQWEMIKAALQAKVPRYNFYGISGSFTEDSEDYGVFLFKQRLGADVIELLGDFKCVCAPKIYRQYTMLHRLKDKLQKR